MDVYKLMFVNSENNKTSESYRLLLNLSYKIELKISHKFVAFSKSQYLLSKERYKKIHTKTINLKCLE